VLRPGSHDLLRHLRSAGVFLLLLERLRLHGRLDARRLLRPLPRLDDHLVGDRDGGGLVARGRPAGAGEAGFDSGGCAVTNPQPVRCRMAAPASPPARDARPAREFSFRTGSVGCRAMPLPASSRLQSLSRAARLRCPRCGEGRLFKGWFAMHDGCPHCGLSFVREQGFYLGSIYLNYGATVIATGALYALLVLGLGWSHEATLAACLAVAVTFPIWFFRHARSFLLAMDCAVNRGGQSDDANAGCFLGIALALILLFGIGMAVVTLSFTDGGATTADQVPLE